jgi:phage FluMu protein Com
MSKKPLLGVGFLLLIFTVMLMLSLTFLYLGFIRYSTGSADSTAYLMTGAFGALLAFYGIMQLRKKTAYIHLLNYNIVTTSECEECGFKSLRKFERGDYVFKPVDKCPKCNKVMIITSIHSEEKTRKGLL